MGGGLCADLAASEVQIAFFRRCMSPITTTLTRRREQKPRNKNQNFLGGKK
jgi:hypothetical protein